MLERTSALFYIRAPLESSQNKDTTTSENSANMNIFKSCMGVFLVTNLDVCQHDAEFDAKPDFF